MNNRYIYSSQEKVSKALQDFDRLTNSCHEQYQNKIDQGIWERIQSSSMYLGYTLPILFKTPKPDPARLIELLFQSEYNDEAYAAALMLKDDELNERIEFRSALMNELKKIEVKNLSIDQKARIQNIVLFTELAHGENRRKVIGKTIHEIESDSRFYMQTAYEAQEILSKIKPTFIDRIRIKLKNIL